MQNPESKNPAAYQSSTTPVQEAERRTNDRQMLTVTAEVVDFVTGSRFSTRTMDLGPGGCFIDTANPLPVSSKVHVRLLKGQNAFQTSGTVVYSQNGLGMGIAFSSLDAEQQASLDAWLLGMAMDRPVPAKPASESAGASAKQLGESKVMTRLLRLLVMKGILAESEASSILIEPFV